MIFQRENSYKHQNLVIKVITSQYLTIDLLFQFGKWLITYIIIIIIDELFLVVPPPSFYLRF